MSPAHWIAPMAAAAALALTATAAHAGACEDLLGAKIGHGVVTKATPYAQGAGVEMGAFGIPPLPAGKAFCRVEATLTPVKGSSIKVEVWLPDAASWNGKLMASGNGGYGGTLGGPRLAMRPALRRGYATTGTDMGHTEDGASGENASWALNQPVKIADFGHRANHETALFAKAVVRRYYGSAPKHAYFQGCSDGGREALMEAQRYPGDYDGIIAGAPAAPWTRLMTSFAWTWKSAHATPGQAIPDAKLPLIQAAVMADCDMLDGVKDGVLEDPRLCRFDPVKIQCQGADAATCLTAGEVAALKAIYSGPKNPRSGAALFPGYPAGGEAIPNAWTLWISGPKAQHPSFSRSFFSNFVFNDAAWTLDRLDFDRDPPIARKRMASQLDSDNPNLAAFKAKGGKLILFHGWADAAITPYSTIDYYEAVRGKMGVKNADSFSRLFMVPGMSHCLAGPGATDFDMLAVMENWVEKAQAPEQVTARKYANDYATLLDMPAGEPTRTRTLCAWPKVAAYKGQGSTDDAASFTCKVPVKS